MTVSAYAPSKSVLFSTKLRPSDILISLNVLGKWEFQLITSVPGNKGIGDGRPGFGRLFWSVTPRDPNLNWYNHILRVIKIERIRVYVEDESCVFEYLPVKGVYDSVPMESNAFTDIHNLPFFLDEAAGDFRLNRNAGDCFAEMRLTSTIGFYDGILAAPQGSNVSIEGAEAAGYRAKISKTGSKLNWSAVNQYVDANCDCYKYCLSDMYSLWDGGSIPKFYSAESLEYLQFGLSLLEESIPSD